MSRVASLVACVLAVYSASVELSATVCCRLLCHVIAQLISINAYQIVERLVFVSLPQSVSQ
jgi:hypothetical protein